MDVIEEELTVAELTDAELTAEALAADADAPLPDDAVPFDADEVDAGMLPEWYMPAPRAGSTRGRKFVFTVLAASLVTCNVVGFCVTFGFPEFVWH